jgi:hypothetical protein
VNKAKIEKFVMWGIKESARSLTNLIDTFSNPIAPDFIEKLLPQPPARTRCGTKKE